VEARNSNKLFTYQKIENEIMKQCTICNEIKNDDDFYIKNKQYGTRNNTCKKCISNINKNERFKCRKITLKEQNLRKCSICKVIKSIDEFYSQTHRCKICQKEYDSQEIIRIRKRKNSRIWSNNNREYINTYMNERYHSNIDIKLSCCISSVMNYSLRHNKNGNHWEILVNFTLNELKIHLQNLFQPGMSWENYGDWQIDHIKPITSFNITSYDDQDFKNCWNLKNLQPLWADENRRKMNKI